MGRAEADLGRIVVQARATAPVEPGVAMMRELVAAIRRGLSITALPLTLRLLRFARGDGALDEAFERCWTASAPHLYADAEARNLAVALRERFGDVPHLAEVLDYELALDRAGPPRDPRDGGVHLRSRPAARRAPRRTVPGRSSSTPPVRRGRRR